MVVCALDNLYRTCQITFKFSIADNVLYVAHISLN